MAVWTSEPHTPAVLSAAEQWRTNCMVQSGSLFTNRNLWTSDNLASLKRHYVDNLIEGDGSFYDKLQKQIGDAPSAVIQLAAEAIWFLNLFVLEGSMGRTRSASEYARYGSGLANRYRQVSFLRTIH
jgi:5-methylcytosine-specific restriction protein B